MFNFLLLKIKKTMCNQLSLSRMKECISMVNTAFNADNESTCFNSGQKTTIQLAVSCAIGGGKSPVKAFRLGLTYVKPLGQSLKRR